MKNILFICVLFFLSSKSYATEKISSNDCSITGTVVDAVTKKPVADVIITAKGMDIDSELRVITDELGQYKMPGLAAGTYSLKFQKENYKVIEKKNLPIKRTSPKMNVELYQEDGADNYHHNWLLKSELI